MKYLMSILAALAVISFGGMAVAGSPGWNLSLYVCSDYSPNVETKAGNTDNCLEMTDEEKEEYMEELYEDGGEGDDSGDDDSDD